MKATDLIQETVDYYSQDPKNLRARNEYTCFYNYNGKKCAVGRCLLAKKNPPMTQHGKYLTGYISSIKIGYYDDDTNEECLIPKDEIQDLFKKKYRGFPIPLWDGLQKLHDSNNYWDDEGLTDTGKERVAALMESWKDTTND